MKAWDIIVAGGGSAGIAAALAAARQGANTLLIERQMQLGGMGTNALVHTFCGLFHPDVSRPWSWLNPGIPTEIGSAMMMRTGQSSPDLMGQVYVLRQHPSLFADIAEDCCAAEPTLSRLSGAEWTGLQRHDDGWLVTTHSHGQIHQHLTKAIVDTTGDATGARLYDSSLLNQAASAQLYRPAYICQLSQVQGSRDDAWRLEISARIVRAVRDQTLPATALGTGFRASPFAGELFVTIDLEAGQGAWNPQDPIQRAQVEAEGRRTALALWRWLRDHHPDFAQTPPPQLPAQAGIRESARYRGDYEITGDDLVTSRRFDDEIALAGWPMEKRETARGPKFRFFDQPEPAGIPARCLQITSVPGLYFAGRCLSADHDALASLRVMGTCMATGQAAGRLAAEFANPIR